MTEFRMPSLGADMEAGTLREWFVKPGDTVKRGDIVAVVETQKGLIDIEIFEAGIIEKLLIKTDEKVPVGTVMATLIPAEVKIQAKPVIKEVIPEKKPVPVLAGTNHRLCEFLHWPGAWQQSIISIPIVAPLLLRLPGGDGVIIAPATIG